MSPLPKEYPYPKFLQISFLHFDSKAFTPIYLLVCCLFIHFSLGLIQATYFLPLESKYCKECWEDLGFKNASFKDFSFFTELESTWELKSQRDMAAGFTGRWLREAHNYWLENKFLYKLYFFLSFPCLSSLGKAKCFLKPKFLNLLLFWFDPICPMVSLWVAQKYPNTTWVGSREKDLDNDVLRNLLHPCKISEMLIWTFDEAKAMCIN